jgi:hypothetical protein
MTRAETITKCGAEPSNGKGHMHGAMRRRAARSCRGNGRFPYTKLTSSPTKIIASAK